MKDVIEAMCVAYMNREWNCKGSQPNHNGLDSMQAALTAAAAMGYTLAPDEQTLPELPEGYLMSIDFHRQQDDSYMYSCFLMKRGNLIADDRPINLRGTAPTPRAAVLAAISKIDGGGG